MLELTAKNFDDEVNVKGKVIVIDFWASWCAPCLSMAPIFEETSKELKNITFAKVDVDKNPEIPSKFEVMSIPTFIIFKDGKEVDRIIGTKSRSEFKAKIEAAAKK